MIAGKSLQAWLDRADALGAEGRFFEAHEELEIAWKAASGGEKVLLQGLIQIAAGLHRLRLHPGKTDGAIYLLDRGLEKLRANRRKLDSVTLADLERRIDEVRDSPQILKNFRFGLRAV